LPFSIELILRSKTARVSVNYSSGRGRQSSHYPALIESKPDPRAFF
jgi:hypothetical protein